MYGTPKKPARLSKAAKAQAKGGSGPPGSAGKGWKITPDQRDRNGEYSEDRMRGWQSGAEEQRAQRRAKNRRLPAAPVRRTDRA